MKLFNYLSIEFLNDMIDKGYIDQKISPCKNFKLFDYSRSCQFEGMWNDVTIKCRGLVVDNNTDDIIGMVMPKFFNIEETYNGGQKIFDECLKYQDLSIEVTEKMDGSFINCWWNKYKEQWQCSTRGSFESDQAKFATEWINKNDYMMYEFARPAGSLGYFNLIFECIYPENRVVIDYGDFSGLILLTGYWYNGKEYKEYLRGSLEDISESSGIKIAPLYSEHKSLQGLINICKTLDGNHEGFVVRFSNGFRVKIKGQEYCRLHKILSGLSTKAIWENLDIENHCIKEDFLKAVPEEFLDEVKEYGENLLKKIYDDLYDIASFSDAACIEAEKLFGPEYTQKQLYCDVLLKHHGREMVSLIMMYIDLKTTKLFESVWKKHQPEFKKMSIVGEEE